MALAAMHGFYWFDHGPPPPGEEAYRDLISFKEVQYLREIRAQLDPGLEEGLTFIAEIDNITGGGFTPDDLPDLELWARADTLTGLSDDDPIQTWPDESGKGNDLTQATSGKRPLYKINVLNGRPVVRFDGVDDVLEATPGITTFPVTIVVVAREIGTGATIYERAWMMGAATDLNLWTDGQYPNATWAYWQTDPGNVISTVEAENWVVASVVLISTAAGDGTWFLDGVAQTTFDPAPGNDPWTNIFNLGGDDSANYCNLEVAEVIIYSRALPAAERRRVEGYLGAKWGVARTPGELSGLELWLRADSISGLDDGDPVETWTDESGEGNDVTQGTAAKRPLYKTNVQNGLPVVRFDGSDDYLQRGFTLAQPYTRISAFKQVSWTVNDRVFSSGPGMSQAPLYQNATTPNLRMYAGTQGPENSNLAVGAFGIVVEVFNGVSSSLQVNNTTPVSGDVGAATPNGITLGAHIDGTLSGEVDIGEVVVYSRLLTAEELDQIKAYLAAKWGVAL